MTNGMEDAAKAFDSAISGERGNPAAPPKSNGASKPTETMFPNLGMAEVDDESPPSGGGDEEDVLYGETPEEGKDDGTPNEEEETPDEGEEEESSDEEEGSDAKYTVMVDGEEREVSLKEALEGYIRTETFHRRLSEVAETNKVIQRAASEVVQNYEYARQMIDVMEGQMNEMVPPEPDWDKLFAEDPAKARNLQKYYQQVEAFKGKLKQQREDVAKAVENHQSQQLKAFAEKEEIRFARLNAKNWGTDPKKKSKDLQSMRRTALQEGFSQEEINQVYDSRMLMILLKASKYDRIMAARPKPVVAGSKPVTPGPGNKRTGRRSINEAMKKLARSGSIEDAAPVFDQILNRR